MLIVEFLDDELRKQMAFPVLGVSVGAFTLRVRSPEGKDLDLADNVGALGWRIRNSGQASMRRVFPRFIVRTQAA